jgi:hypothetical protein
MNKRPSRIILKGAGTTLAFLAITLASGCWTTANVSDDVEANVSGKVKVGNKTVKFGTVTFWDISNFDNVFAAAIEKDGTYQISRIPVGTYAVTVYTIKPPWPPIKTGAPSDPGTPPGETEVQERKEWEELAKRHYVEIPKGYTDLTKTKFTIEINSGDNTVDLTMKK